MQQKDTLDPVSLRCSFFLPLSLVNIREVNQKFILALLHHFFPHLNCSTLVRLWTHSHLQVKMKYVNNNAMRNCIEVYSIFLMCVHTSGWFDNAIAYTVSCGKRGGEKCCLCFLQWKGQCMIVLCPELMVWLFMLMSFLLFSGQAKWC